MNRKLRSVLAIPAAAFLLWNTAHLCLRFGANSTMCAMILLLEVLGIASVGDSVLALLSSAAASLALSFFFIDDIGSFRLRTLESVFTFAAMVLTAAIGSRLSIQSRNRALEAIRRREEMERLNDLGGVLLAVNTVPEAAENAVRKLVELFGLNGAALRLEGFEQPFLFGQAGQGELAVIPVNPDHPGDLLELRGSAPSEEVRTAIASMINLVLARARSAEERARTESTRRGEELRSTVLNALAHHFKTPLTSIKAAASTLRHSDILDGDASRDLIAVIDEESDRLDRLIGEALDLARLEARRASPRTEDCVLSEIVGRVAQRMSRYLGRRELLVEIPDDLPTIAGDKFLLEQMLVPVVDNAWKYSRPGAGIYIGAAVAGDRIELTVRNDGSQIPERERALIFDKFYRGSQYRSTVEGTGLGLAIARSIAEAYEGTVSLEIEPRGPAFRFALPLGPPASTPGNRRDLN